MEIGWIGVGRMGLAMTTRLLKAGHRLSVWNRTRAKAESLQPLGARLVGDIAELRKADVVFLMLATGKDLKEVCFGDGGLAAAAEGRKPRIIVDCSTISLEDSQEVRARLLERGVQFLAAPVSGNPKCVVAGLLSTVASGPKAAFDEVESLMACYSGRGATYVGEGDLSRICKIGHNMFLATMFESLLEVTLMAQKAGIPRHAFLQFINSSVLGSVFTRYKSPALVNLDFTPTFTPALLRKDVDLAIDFGRKAGVAMPGAATTREFLQAHIGAAAQQRDPAAYLAKDFATMIETMALMAGVKLEPENVAVASGLETPAENGKA